MKRLRFWLWVFLWLGLGFAAGIALGAAPVSRNFIKALSFTATPAPPQSWCRVETAGTYGAMIERLGTREHRIAVTRPVFCGLVVEAGKDPRAVIVPIYGGWE